MTPSYSPDDKIVVIVVATDVVGHVLADVDTVVGVLTDADA
jgi:hypothetical protein